MLNRILILLTTVFLLNSCYKEEINVQPEFISYEISEANPNPGDTVTISIATEDKDGDKITYSWKADNGIIITNTEQSSIQWVVPFIEGVNYPTVEISDGKVIYSKQIPVECPAYINDNFSVNFLNKDTSNTLITWSDTNCTIKASKAGSDYQFFEVPDIAVEPPYAVYMDLNTVYSNPFFSPTDKYGIYLDFWNVGTDTLIKALWFRIYPTSDSKIWTINILKDNGRGNKWEEISNHKMGTGNLVSKQTGFVNKLKLVVGSDNSITVYNNDELIIATDILLQKYSNNITIPGLQLQKAGVRGSNGSITIDNFLVTRDTRLLSKDLFKN